MTATEIALADQLLTQGLTYWAQFAAQKAAGALTMGDLSAAAAKLDADLNQLELDIKAQAVT